MRMGLRNSIGQFSGAVLGSAMCVGLVFGEPVRGKKEAAPPTGPIIQIGEAGDVVVGGVPGPVFGLEGQAVKLSDYWLGVHAVPVDPLTKAHLKLEHGLAVMHVAPDGPASKAGVKDHDILLQFGDAKLKELSDLIEALDKNKDQAAELKLLREGKETGLKITPAKREGHAAPAEGAPFPAAPAEVQRWFQKLGRGDGHEPLRMFFARPGMMLPSAELKKFPANLSISVQKEGDKPAQIKVQQGDKSWEVSEDKIDELPEDVRPFVKQFLGKQFDFDVKVEGFAGPGAPGVRVREFFGGEAGAMPEVLDQQFQELHRMIDRLQQQFQAQPGIEPMRKELEELRQQLKDRRGERKEKLKEGQEKKESPAESKTEAKT